MSEIGDFWKDVKEFRRHTHAANEKRNFNDFVTAAKKHDIGFRFVNQLQGHLRVDGNIDFWIARAKYWCAKEDIRGQGVGSLVDYILARRGESRE